MLATLPIATFSISFVAFVVCVVASTPFVLIAIEFLFAYFLHVLDVFV